MRPTGSIGSDIRVAAHAWGGMYETRERSQRAESERCVEKYRCVLRICASRRAISRLYMYTRSGGGTRGSGVRMQRAVRRAQPSWWPEGLISLEGLGPLSFISPRRHSPEAEGSLGGSSSSSMQRASSRRWPTAEGVRGAVRGRGARQAGAARCASQYAGCGAGASCAGVGLAQAGPASAAAACVARRGGLTIRFTVHSFFPAGSRAATRTHRTRVRRRSVCVEVRDTLPYCAASSRSPIRCTQPCEACVPSFRRGCRGRDAGRGAFTHRLRRACRRDRRSEGGMGAEFC